MFQPQFKVGHARHRGCIKVVITLVYETNLRVVPNKWPNLNIPPLKTDFIFPADEWRE